MDRHHFDGVALLPVDRGQLLNPFNGSPAVRVH
jgi:hypothetical protein